jgi:hypothetical protein
MMISSFPTWRCTSKCGITIISREDGWALGSPVQKQFICMVIVQSGAGG